MILLFVVHFTKRITEPIERLTELTQELKQATDVEAKKEVIQKVKNEQIFHFMRRDEDSGSQKPEEESLLQKIHSSQNETVTDEIEELKKIFYEFFVDDNAQTQKKFHPSPKYYKKSRSHGPITLDTSFVANKTVPNMSLHDLLDVSQVDGDHHDNGSTPLNDTIGSLGEFQQDAPKVQSKQHRRKESAGGNKVSAEDVPQSYSINRNRNRDSGENRSDLETKKTSSGRARQKKQ